MKQHLSLASRTFLFAFIPMALTLVASFVAINRAVEDRIRDRLRDSLRRTEGVWSFLEAEYSQNSARGLAGFAENSSLKAGLNLLREVRDPAERAQAIETVAAQLANGSIDYDMLLLRDADGRSIVGLIGPERVRLALERVPIETISASLVRVEGTLYETVSVPVNLSYENLGSLVLGKQFNTRTWADFGHTILVGKEGILHTTFSLDVAAEAVEQLGSRCGGTNLECEVALRGEAYLALPVRRITLGDEVRLISFQSIDQAAAEFTRSLAGVFPMIGGAGVLALLLLSAIASHSVARPLVRLVAHLRHEQHQGSFPTHLPSDYQTHEVNELAREFSRAAGAVRESERRLDEATEQFIESMTQAQDARDPHTAGHSERVSLQSVTIANALGLRPGEVETIRIGARLHDLGKIGIPDAVLRKPGKLTPEEFSLIQRHPRIGRDILEKVGQFETFLPIVELHHENPDGSGYPYGLKASEIPMPVRIVHVADVYDAVTSDRAYRTAMSEEEAWDLMLAGMGTLFDADVIEALWEVLGKGKFNGRPRHEAHTHENDTAFYSLPRML